MAGMALNGVEIFRSGTWNGDKYSVEDLDAMVDAFGKVGYQVPIKLGHSDETGGMAYGWVNAIRRVGETLVADFIDLPEQIYQFIKDRRFDHVSAEIYWNIKRGAETFKRALKAVALLGAETPGVAGLKPLREVAMSDQHEGVHIHALATEEEPMSDPKDKATIEELNGKVAKLTADLTEATTKLEAAIAEGKTGKQAADEVKALKASLADLSKNLAAVAEERRKESVETKIKSLRVPAFAPHLRAIYDFATAAPKTVKFSAKAGEEAKDTDIVAVIDGLVEAINAKTEKMFKAISGGADSKEFEMEAADTTEDAGANLSDKAKAYMKEKGEKDYMKAFNAVLDDPANAELKSAYLAA